MICMTSLSSSTTFTFLCWPAHQTNVTRCAKIQLYNAAHRHNAYPGLPKLALQSITDGIARLELAQVRHTSRSTQRDRNRSRSHAAGNSSSLPNARSVADSRAHTLSTTHHRTKHAAKHSPQAAKCDESPSKLAARLSHHVSGSKFKKQRCCAWMGVREFLCCCILSYAAAAMKGMYHTVAKEQHFRLLPMCLSQRNNRTLSDTPPGI